MISGDEAKTDPLYYNVYVSLWRFLIFFIGLSLCLMCYGLFKMHCTKTELDKRKKEAFRDNMKDLS